jgi:phage tail sheath gpL-like
MGIPVAISPTVRTPGLALSINLLAGAASPGTAPLRACVIATKTSTGTITADTQLIQAISGPDAAGTAYGSGSPGHLAVKRCFEEYGLGLVDIVAATEAVGVAATQTIVFDDGSAGGTTNVTAPWTVDLEICGRLIEILWAAGETDIQGATKLVAAINALSADLPVTASNGGGTLATVTITAKAKGTWGNDVPLALTYTGGTGGTIVLTGANLTGGTTEIVITTALATISGTEYDFILLCTSSTDAGLASATSGPGRLKTHITTYLGPGFGVKLQQAIVGTVGTLATAKTGTAQHNFAEMQYAFANKGRSLGAEFGGAELGRRLRDEATDATYNPIGNAYKAQLFGPKDLVADSLTATQVEDSLQSGVYPILFTSTGAAYVSRPITTYFKDTASNPDDRVLDVSQVSGSFRVAKDFRVALPQQFPNRKLSADLTPGADEPPDGVTEVREVKSFLATRALFWVKKGVLRRDKLLAAIADGSFIVQVDSSDASQCDVVFPYAIVKPLAKFSLVMNKVA